MMKESGISAQKLALCRILSIPNPFELLASKIGQFREDFHLVIVRVESLEGSRLRLPGCCQQPPSRTPGPPTRRSGSFVVAAPPRCDLRVESRDHVAEGSTTRVAQAMLTTAANPCSKTLFKFWVLSLEFWVLS